MKIDGAAVKLFENFLRHNLMTQRADQNVSIQAADFSLCLTPSG